MFFILTGICACSHHKELGDWTIKKRVTPSTEYVIPYHPAIQKIVLLPGELDHAVTLIGSYTPDRDPMSPTSIFERLTDIRDSSKKHQRRSYWYVLKLENLTGYQKWELKFTEEKWNPRLFQEIQSPKDTLCEIVRYSQSWEGNEKITELLFEVNLSKSEETFLLNVENDEIPFVYEFTVYPVDKSGATSIDNNILWGLVAGVLSVMTGWLLYGWVYTRKALFLVVWLYVIDSVLRASGLIGPLFFSNRFLGYYAGYLLPIILRYGVLLFIPFREFRLTKRALQLMILMGTQQWISIHICEQ